MKSVKKLWIGMAVLVLLSPLGLILPAKFGAGSAWGEWSAEELHEIAGFLPKGFAKPEPWSAPVPDYALKGQENAGLASLSLSYILSAILGIAVVAVVCLLIGKLLTKKEEQDAA